MQPRSPLQSNHVHCYKATTLRLQISHVYINLRKSYVHCNKTTTLTCTKPPSYRYTTAPLSPLHSRQVSYLQSIHGHCCKLLQNIHTHEAYRTAMFISVSDDVSFVNEQTHCYTVSTGVKRVETLALPLAISSMETAGTLRGTNHTRRRRHYQSVFQGMNQS